MIGNGTEKDLTDIQSLGKMVRSSSRCGLGQSSPNPLLSALENFKDFFQSKVRKDTDYLSQFDLKFSIAESCVAADRKANLEHES